MCAILKKLKKKIVILKVKMWQENTKLLGGEKII